MYAYATVIYVRLMDTLTLRLAYIIWPIFLFHKFDILLLTVSSLFNKVEFSVWLNFALLDDFSKVRIKIQKKTIEILLVRYYLFNQKCLFSCYIMAKTVEASNLKE